MNIPLKHLAIATGIATVMLAGMSVSSAQAGKGYADGQRIERMAGGKTRAQKRKLSRKAAALADANQAGKVDVIVVYKNRPGRSEDEEVVALGGKVKRRFNKLGMRKLSVSPRRLERLANNPNIALIAVDEPVTAFSAAARKTAKLPPQAAANGIYDGSGVTVAVLDSGVADHADLDVNARVDMVQASANCNFSVRDEFNNPSFSNDDGSSIWTGSWEEDDVAGSGAGSGNVMVVDGELLLDDYTDTGTQPSATRSVDLSQTTSATLRFDFRTSSGVDANQDRITVDVSSNGGQTFSTLELFDTYAGATTGSRSYDLISI